jgi:hypothetical protein
MLKDAQGALRHASIKTTGDVYMQTIEASVLDAVNSRTRQILAGWKGKTAEGERRNARRSIAIGPSWTKRERRAYGM